MGQERFREINGVSQRELGLENQEFSGNREGEEMSWDGS